MRNGDVLASRFVIERLAGIGGMGKVYRASDQETGFPVAVKVLLADDGGDIERFEREARILSELEHPRIVRYVARGALPEGEPYLVMEWLEGEDLGARLERGPLGAAEAMELAIRVGDALGAIHDRGIVHRDLKPSNVFLVDGRIEGAKLLDFGIARSEAASRLTGSGMLLGTAPYMAPEQASGAPVVDARADVFALGCVLFECLTAKKAFDGAHVMAILAKILFSDSPRLKDSCPDLPAPLCALVDRMLSKSPAERPANARVVTDALRRLGESFTLQGAETVEMPGPSALTQSEQRSVAIIFIGPAAHGAHSNDERLAAEAAAHGGRFDRLVGGSAAVLLSGPRVATDLAAQAARCALALRRHAEGRGIALAIGRSAATGQMSTVGPAIDRAARLLGRGASSEPTSTDHVNVDDVTVGLLDARFDVLGDGSAFVLRAEREIADVRTLLGKPTPCVGRDRELRQIEESFDDCVSEGRARAVLLTGGAGMGKSRIGREIVQRLRARSEPLSIWFARGELLGAGSAMGMLADLVRGACDIRVGEPASSGRDKLHRYISDRIPAEDRRRVTDFLGEIIGARFPDEDNLPLFAARHDAQLMGDQIRAAFIDLLRAECRRTPVFVLLEDLHWGDGATVRILDAALRDLEEKPLFVLALARPEVHEAFPKLWANRGFEEKRLQQLGKKAGEQLARHVLGERVGAETLERIVRLSDGNAFYLEELIRATADGKSGDLPETVVAMVQSRLAGLPEVQRRILRGASIFGETFWSGGIATLLGVPSAPTNTTMQIRNLVDCELVTKQRESRFVGEEEYGFRHALVREGAYAMLTEEDRKLGHRLAGQWLEDHGEVDPLVLAEHFQKGGEEAKASAHYLRAAALACQSGDSSSAIRHAQRGLDAGASGQTQIGLLGVFCEANAYSLEQPESASSHAAHLLREAAPGSPPWMQAALMRVVGSTLFGKMDDLVDTLERILAAPPSPGAADMMSLCVAAGASVLHGAGMARAARVMFDRASDFVDRMGPREVAAKAWLDLFNLYRPQEDPWGALQRIREVRDVGRALGDIRMQVGAQISMGSILANLGRFSEAERALCETTVADHELGPGGSIRPRVLSWLYADLGDFEKARSWAERLLETSQTRGVAAHASHGHWMLAEVLRRSGDLERADAEIQAALAAAAPVDQPSMLATLAALRLAQGRPAEALAAAEEGMAKYEAMGACSAFFRPAILLLVHVDSLLSCGRHEDARAAAAKAEDWLLGVAAKIDDEEYRRSFSTIIPENRRIFELAFDPPVTTDPTRR